MSARAWAVPSEPDRDVEQLRGERSGKIWNARTLETGKRVWNNGDWTCSWPELLAEELAVTEVVETEVEAAARRLREAGLTERSTATMGRHYEDMRIVLAHVLNGGTL